MHTIEELSATVASLRAQVAALQETVAGLVLASGNGIALDLTIAAHVSLLLKNSGIKSSACQEAVRKALLDVGDTLPHSAETLEAILKRMGFLPKQSNEK